MLTNFLNDFFYQSKCTYLIINLMFFGQLCHCIHKLNGVFNFYIVTDIPLQMN